MTTKTSEELLRCPSTIEDLRKIGRDIQAIGDGTYKWPSFEIIKDGDLTILKYVTPEPRPLRTPTQSEKE